MDNVIPDYSRPLAYYAHLENGIPKGSCYLAGERVRVVDMTPEQLKALINLAGSIRAFAENALEIKLEVESLTDF